MPQARFKIVAQNLGRLGSKALGRLALAAGLALAGVVTAFGLAPGTATEQVERSQVVENARFGAAAPAQESALHTYWREEIVQRGDTLARLLARLGVHDAEAMAYLARNAEAQIIFELIPGRTLLAGVDQSGALVALQLQNGERVLTITRNEEQQFAISEHEAPLERQVLSASGVIGTSLFAAFDAAKIPDAVAKKLIEMFSTDIDFHRGLRRGDRFAVVYEVLTDRGDAVRTGRILAAEFTAGGKTHNRVWFGSEATAQKSPHTGAHFTFDGRDTRKTAFLRSPVEVSRVSSGFAEDRYDPVSKDWKLHKGVDYAAPIGTNILAVADGVVEFAGVQPGYGNVVILQHGNGYSTLYAHMQDFEAGIAQGAKVRQGDIIGTVGMTGFTTGPHVHFEFMINGEHHDPESVDMPKAAALAADVKKAIRDAAKPYERIVARLREKQPAVFE